MAAASTDLSIAVSQCGHMTPMMSQETSNAVCGSFLPSRGFIIPLSHLIPVSLCTKSPGRLELTLVSSGHCSSAVKKQPAHPNITLHTLAWKVHEADNRSPWTSGREGYVVLSSRERQSSGNDCNATLRQPFCYTPSICLRRHSFSAIGRCQEYSARSNESSTCRHPDQARKAAPSRRARICNIRRKAHVHLHIRVNHRAWATYE